MISEHRFNSDWWGAPAGISSSVDVLTADRSQLSPACQPYAWVEARAHPGSPRRLAGTYKRLRLGRPSTSYRASLNRIETLPEDWSYVSAEERSIDLSDFAEFNGERYSRLPGITPRRIADRYQRWADNLVEKHPSACATILKGNQAAGYVFGSVNGRKAEFTLAVASRSASVPGLGIYLGAASLYRDLGASTMVSSLSAANLSALNAHVAIGCLFVSATGVWLRPTQASETSLPETLTPR